MLLYSYLCVISCSGLFVTYLYLVRHPQHAIIFVRVYTLLMQVFVSYERYFTTSQGSHFPFFLSCILFIVLFTDRYENFCISLAVITGLYTAAGILTGGLSERSFIFELFILFISLHVGKDAVLSHLYLFENNRLLKIQRDTDILTGLPNRRRLFEVIGESEKNRESSSLHIDAVYMADIDFFKQYNDTFGHQSGDECLKKVGAAFTAAARTTGIEFFRYGGEEFAGIIRSRNIQRQAHGIKNISYREQAQLLVDAVRSLAIPFESGIAHTVTLSCGFVIVPYGNTLSAEKLLEQADKALYRAKENGRNQTAEYAL